MNIDKEMLLIQKMDPKCHTQSQIIWIWSFKPTCGSAIQMIMAWSTSVCCPEEGNLMTWLQKGALSGPVSSTARWRARDEQVCTHPSPVTVTQASVYWAVGGSPCVFTGRDL